MDEYTTITFTDSPILASEIAAALALIETQEEDERQRRIEHERAEVRQAADDAICFLEGIFGASLACEFAILEAKRANNSRRRATFVYEHRLFAIIKNDRHGGWTLGYFPATTTSLTIDHLCQTRWSTDPVALLAQIGRIVRDSQPGLPS